jgi:hypothetical protein
MAPSFWSDQLQNHRMWRKEDCLSSAMTTGQLFLELWWPPTDPSPLHRRPQNHSLPSRHVRISSNGISVKTLCFRRRSAFNAVRTNGEQIMSRGD